MFPKRSGSELVGIQHRFGSGFCTLSSTKHVNISGGYIINRRIEKQWYSSLKRWYQKIQIEIVVKGIISRTA